MKFTQVKKYVSLHNTGLIYITDILSEDDFLIHGIKPDGTLSLSRMGVLTYTTPMGIPYRINDLTKISRILTRQEVNTDVLSDISDYIGNYIHDNSCGCHKCNHHKPVIDNDCNCDNQKPSITPPSCECPDEDLDDEDIVYDTHDMFYNLQKYVNNGYVITDDMVIQDVDLEVDLRLVANS